MFALSHHVSNELMDVDIVSVHVCLQVDGDLVFLSRGFGFDDELCGSGILAGFYSL